MLLSIIGISNSAYSRGSAGNIFKIINTSSDSSYRVTFLDCRVIDLESIKAQPVAG